MKTYTIRTGDSLFLVAKKFYGDGYTYKLLAAYNQITNPNNLEVGRKLEIPPHDQLHAQAPSLDDWHRYGDGTISWRVTPNGVEIQGKGLIRKKTYTKQAKRIWQKYQQPILAASQKHGVSVPVIIATIVTESSGNPQAYRYEPAFYKRHIEDKEAWKDSPYHDEPKRISASYGLMQVMYTTAYSTGFRGKPEDLYDPETIIDVGAAYIASPFQRRQHQWDPPKIACAYNAGSVRPTRKNAWGMFYHPGHLDRWVPSYNGAIEVIGPTSVAEPPKPEPEDIVPQPETPPVVVSETSPNPATLHLLFPDPNTGAWNPIIVDLFRHTETGINDPVSFTIAPPRQTTGKRYIYAIPNLVPGVYDLVLADAVSSSIVFDVADYELTAPKGTIDLRQNLQATSSTTQPTSVTVIFRFGATPGSAWRPMIVDVCQHTADGRIGNPVPYTIKIPSHGPDGSYTYEISDFAPGVYDFVFTDAATSSVLQDIADYVVDENPEIIDLRNTRSLYQQPEPVPTEPVPTEPVPKQKGGMASQSLWRRLLSLFSGK